MSPAKFPPVCSRDWVPCTDGSAARGAGGAGTGAVGVPLTGARGGPQADGAPGPSDDTTSVAMGAVLFVLWPPALRHMEEPETEVQHQRAGVHEAVSKCTTIPLHTPGVHRKRAHANQDSVGVTNLEAKAAPERPYSVRQRPTVPTHDAPIDKETCPERAGLA